MEDNKITLEEFWNSKEKLAIHCDTEEKAIKLLRAFNKMGKKWKSRDSYKKIFCGIHTKKRHVTIIQIDMALFIGIKDMNI